MNGSAIRAIALALGPLGLLGQPDLEPTRAARTPVLYFFMTPGAEGGPDGAKRLAAFLKRHPGQLRLRPVLLVHDWSTLRTMTEKSSLYGTLKELEGGGKPGTLDIPLYDEEGLGLAERWEIRAVPAYVLVKNGKAHRTAGSSADLEHLWDCSK